MLIRKLKEVMGNGSMNLFQYFFSLWEMKHYTESQAQYEKALALRKSLENCNITFTRDKDRDRDRELAFGVLENFTEIEIKFRIAKNMVENHQYKEANSLLQSIPIKQRPAKANMLICKIQNTSESGTEKNLIQAYKEVLKKCPLAFECIDGLLGLGLKGNEVNSLIIGVTSENPCFEWINFYIKGVSEMQSRKYQDAITTLTSIDCMRNNPRILAIIGEIYFHSGEYETSYNYLKKSYDLYPFMKQGLQKFTMLLDMFKKTRELEELIKASSSNSHVYEYSSENWFVLSQYLYSCQKLEKAQYFINRVIILHQQKNVDALILNAKILHGNKKSNEALISLRQALKYEPYRFECHRWLIEILLATDRVRDAQNQATKSLKILGDSPRTLTLAASTFLKNPISKDKAKVYLQKALELNDRYSKAVFLYSQILIDDQELKAATKLLEKTVAVMSNVKIILMLGDLYAKTKNLSSSLEQYTRVLNIDTTNRHALNGIMALSSISTTGSTSLESAEEDSEILETSRNKNDESDSNELVWSDQDIEIN